MIFTRYGSRVRSVVGIEESTGWARVVIERDNGETDMRDVHLSDLRADGGIAEILDAAPKVDTHA